MMSLTLYLCRKNTFPGQMRCIFFSVSPRDRDFPKTGHKMLAKWGIRLPNQFLSHNTLLQSKNQAKVAYFTKLIILIFGCPEEIRITNFTRMPHHIISDAKYWYEPIKFSSISIVCTISSRSSLMSRSQTHSAVHDFSLSKFFRIFSSGCILHTAHCMHYIFGNWDTSSMTPWLDVLLAHLISLHHCMRPNINHLIIIIAMVDSALSLSSLREQKKDFVIEE